MIVKTGSFYRDVVVVLPGYFLRTQFGLLLSVKAWL
jgi:hypothetical protein